jgi:hypothetical protein
LKIKINIKTSAISNGKKNCFIPNICDRAQKCQRTFKSHPTSLSSKFAINCCYITHFSVRRLTITASCPMNLQYFPMDRQLCNIEIESCKYPSGAQPEPIAICVCVCASAPSIFCSVHALSHISISPRTYSMFLAAAAAAPTARERTLSRVSRSLFAFGRSARHSFN